MSWPLPFWGGGGGFEVDMWNADTDERTTICVPAASRGGAYSGAQEAMPWRPWKAVGVRPTPAHALGDHDASPSGG